MKDATTLGTLPNLEAFCRSFETGSFSRAAELLGVTPQATSRSGARLEKALGVTLFRRTTRSLAATEAARCYDAACRGALGLLAEGERQLSHQRSSPSGGGRLSLTTPYGHHRLLPALARFRERYPGVK